MQYAQRELSGDLHFQTCINMTNTVHTDSTSVWTVYLFMRKILKLFLILFLVLGILYIYAVYKNKQLLGNEISRVHVVADTNEPEDQEIKLLVRDEILTMIEDIKNGASSKAEAMERLEEQLPILQDAANKVLAKAGKHYKAVVTLLKEEFPTRYYDTFALPAGIYDSLRITIGSGEGKNWWCVVFPDLCSAAASTEVVDSAVEAGFTTTLSKTLTCESGYEIRFWILDCIGKIENFLHMS